MNRAHFECPDIGLAVDRLVAAIDTRQRQALQSVISDHLKLGVPWVAVSGGIDSVFLLCLMRGLFSAETLRVVHFDHGTRGGESRCDAEWVASLCRELGVDCRVGRRNGGDDLSEASLRKERYAYFARELAADSGETPILFAGHHLDDGLENFLIRAARGSGVTGLVSPRQLRRWEGGWLSRPLMDLPADSIHAAMTAAGVPWREDSSNHDHGYLRNRLRASVIPTWKAIAGRNLLAGYQRTRHLLHEDGDAMDWWVDRRMADFPDWPARVRGLRGMPAGFVRRMLLRWLIEHSPGVDVPAAVVDSLVPALSEGGRAADFPFGGGVIHFDGGSGLLFTPVGAGIPPAVRAFRFAVVPPASFYFPDGQILQVRVESVSAEFIGGQLLRADVSREIWIPPQGGILVRNWLPGDRYQPFGMAGTRKLQDCFVDRKIPARERNRRPVVCSSDGSPLWAPGLLPAEACRLHAAAGEVLRLTYGQLC